VYGPAFPDRAVTDSDPGVVRATTTATRVGDTLTVMPSIASDRGGHVELDFAYFLHISVLRDGVPVPITEDRRIQRTLNPLVVPPEPATYRVEVDQEAGVPLTLSTRITAAWTFRSGHANGREVLPLPVLRYEPPIDRDGQTTQRVIALPIRFERPTGAATPRIREATLEASVDDGATWRRVPLIVLGDRGIALIVHPATPSFVSLRGTARDVRGNAVEQTILRVYGVTP
jgi:hypothetical protein